VGYELSPPEESLPPGPPAHPLNDKGVLAAAAAPDLVLLVVVCPGATAPGAGRSHLVGDVLVLLVPVVFVPARSYRHAVSYSLLPSLSKSDCSAVTCPSRASRESWSVTSIRNGVIDIMSDMIAQMSVPSSITGFRPPT